MPAPDLQHMPRLYSACECRCRAARCSNETAAAWFFTTPVPACSSAANSTMASAWSWSAAARNRRTASAMSSGALAVADHLAESILRGGVARDRRRGGTSARPFRATASRCGRPRGRSQACAGRGCCQVPRPVHNNGPLRRRTERHRRRARICARDRRTSRLGRSRSCRIRSWMSRGQGAGSSISLVSVGRFTRPKHASVGFDYCCALMHVSTDSACRIFPGQRND